MEIQSIVPAPDGSRAVFADYSRKKPRIDYLPSPLFALVTEDDGSQYVSPMVCDGRNGMEVAAIMEGYLGWAAPEEGEEGKPYWLERANDALNDEDGQEDDEEEDEDDEEEDDASKKTDEDDEEEDEDDEEEDEDDEEEDEDDEEEDDEEEDEDPSEEQEDEPVGKVRGRRAR